MAGCCWTCWNLYGSVQLEQSLWYMLSSRVAHHWGPCSSLKQPSTPDPKCDTWGVLGGVCRPQVCGRSGEISGWGSHILSNSIYSYFAQTIILHPRNIEQQPFHWFHYCWKDFGWLSGLGRGKYKPCLICVKEIYCGCCKLILWSYLQSFYWRNSGH